MLTKHPFMVIIKIRIEPPFNFFDPGAALEAAHCLGSRGALFPEHINNRANAMKTEG